MVRQLRGEGVRVTRSAFSHRRDPLLSLDRFERANGPTPATYLGSTDGYGALDPLTWTKGFAGATLGLGIVALFGNSVVSNMGNDISTPHAYHTAWVDLLTPDVDLSIDVNVDNQAGKSAGFLLRYTSDSNYWAAQWAALGRQINLYKVVAGVETLVTSTGNLGTQTGRIRVLTQGDAFTLFFPEAVQVGAATDAHNNTATKHGMALRNDPAGSLNSSSLDNWEAR